MNNQNLDALTSNEHGILCSIEAIRERQTKLLFEYLNEKFELDRQLRLLNISEQLAVVNREHKQRLNEVFLKEAK